MIPEWWETCSESPNCSRWPHWENFWKVAWGYGNPVEAWQTPELREWGWGSGETKAPSVFRTWDQRSECCTEGTPEIYRGSPLNFQQRRPECMWGHFGRLERKVLRSIKRNSPYRGTRQGIVPIPTNQKGNTINYGVPWMLNTQKGRVLRKIQLQKQRTISLG